MSDAPATGDVLEIFSDERKRSFLNVDGAGRPVVGVRGGRVPERGVPPGR